MLISEMNKMCSRSVNRIRTHALKAGGPIVSRVTTSSKILCPGINLFSPGGQSISRSLVQADRFKRGTALRGGPNLSRQTCTSKTSPRKYWMVCFLVDAIVFLSLAKTLPSSLRWQRSVDSSIDDRQRILIGFDNSVDNWQAKYFHCSHYVRATVFIKQHTLIMIIVCTIQLNWVLIHVIAFFSHEPV